jgi:hypothetical protein
MSDQPLVPQELQDILDGKSKQPKPPVTGNQRLNQELQKTTVPMRNIGN